jgi:hypothetical protein
LKPGFQLILSNDLSGPGARCSSGRTKRHARDRHHAPGRDGDHRRGASGQNAVREEVRQQHLLDHHPEKRLRRRVDDGCPKPHGGPLRGGYIPEVAPTDTIWFRVPEGKSLSIATSLGAAKWESQVVLYNANGQRHHHTSDQGKTDSFSAGSGCFAIAAYHKRYLGRVNWVWERSDAEWNASFPKGTGAWTFSFTDNEDSGTVLVVVK